MPEQGDIVLVPVPFTDLSSRKRRPVIVISNNQYNRTSADMVVVGMTSQPKPSAYGFTITSADLERGTLNHPGQVRVDKVFALAQLLAVKTFGRVNMSVLDRIRALLQDLASTKP
jgi:mRNA interferase MazF